MQKITLKAEKRNTLGRKVKNLRKQGLLPGNVYGKKVKSEAIQIKSDEFIKVYKEVGETGLFGLIVNNQEKPVLVHNIQTDPVTDGFIHVDFLQVDLKEKVTAQVPVEVIGESPAEKQGLGTAVTERDEVEVEALPADLPEKFEIDASVLAEVDQAIYVKDIKVDVSKVKILDNPEDILVKVEPLRKEEVAPEPSEEVAEEGEAPATPEAEASDAKEGPSETTEPQEQEKEEEKQS